MKCAGEELVIYVPFLGAEAEINCRNGPGRAPGGAANLHFPGARLCQTSGYCPSISRALLPRKSEFKLGSMKGYVRFNVMITLVTIKASV